MTDQMTIEKVLDAANIVDVVSQFVTLRRRGVNYVGLCPFHNEKTPSFYVSPSKGICKCFSCGKGGNVIHFIMEHEQLQYYKAVEWLADKYGIPYSRRELTPEEKLRQDERESLLVVNEFARNWFQNTLLNTEAGRAIGMPYFRKRGFRDDIIEKFQLGYSPERGSALADAALAKGYRREYLLTTGLCYERDDKSLRDRFHGRVIFPVHSVSGKVIAFGGRIMTSEAKVAKYVNSPESPIYRKSNELYGLFFAKQAIVRKDRCFLVEGYADVISMHQAGVENVVASSGTSLTSGQIRLIHRFTSNITVLYDGDKAGIKASIRGIDMLLEEGMNVKVLLLPDGEDPDSFSRSRSASEFQDYLDTHQVDFIRFKVQLLMEEAAGDPIRRASLIRDMTTSISVIPDQIVRAVYLRECSQIMEMDERMLINEVNRLQRERAAAQPKQKAAVPDTIVPDTVASDAGTSDAGTDSTVTAEPAPADKDPVEELRSQIRALLRSDRADIVNKEKMLTRLIVRYGERVCCYTPYQDEEEYPMKVGEYILAAMQNDGLSFCHPVYSRIASLYSEHYREEGFVSERYFLSHPDSVVSLTAANLIEDRYQLSDIYKDLRGMKEDEDLLGTTSHIITDYQLSVVRYEIKQVESKMQRGDSDSFMELQKEYSELLSARNTLAKKLGDRVVT
ncbi:MAG: DNA primase [Bacteroidaceae bacterium]|nr:DNA primase [Bacteroidaceae bacterium]